MDVGGWLTKFCCRLSVRLSTISEKVPEALMGRGRTSITSRQSRQPSEHGAADHFKLAVERASLGSASSGRRMKGQSNQ
jgi:hypothetical protein